MIANDRAFSEMASSARKRLEDRSPEELAARGGGMYDAQNRILRLKSLGQEISLALPEYSFVQPLDKWHQLVILHYLDMADAAPVSDELLAFGGLKDGLIRGTKFDREMERELCGFLKGKHREQLHSLIAACGGIIVGSNADICARFDFLPFYPLWLKIWLADEEFEASGKLLLSRSADHYLTVEDAVTVGSIFLSRLRMAQDN